MGGTPAPTGMAFPSASEPNPIANGLRGTGPMTIIDQTGPAATQPAAPGGPPITTTPPADQGPTGPVGTPYTYMMAGNLIGPSSQYPGYGSNAMYYPAGTNVPAGYSLMSYYDPATGTNYGINQPNAQTGGVYQFNPYQSNVSPEASAFQNLYQGSPYATQGGGSISQAGPGSAPFFFSNPPGQSNPLAAFYNGQAYKTPGYFFGQ